MASIYLETSVLSYLAADRSRDLVVASHQKITQEWWAFHRKHSHLFVSEAVLNEMRQGDSEQAKRRLALAVDLPVLKVNADVRFLARAYRDQLLLPAEANADLLHIAFAVAFRMEFLVTWNCRHIANGHVVRRLLSLNFDMARATPLILTPEELLE